MRTKKTLLAERVASFDEVKELANSYYLKSINEETEKEIALNRVKMASYADGLHAGYRNGYNAGFLAGASAESALRDTGV